MISDTSKWKHTHLESRKSRWLTVISLVYITLTVYLRSSSLADRHMETRRLNKNSCSIEMVIVQYVYKNI